MFLGNHVFSYFRFFFLLDSGLFGSPTKEVRKSEDSLFFAADNILVPVWFYFKKKNSRQM